MHIYTHKYIFMHIYPKVKNNFLDDIFNFLTSFTKFVSPTSFLIL